MWRRVVESATVGLLAVASVFGQLRDYVAIVEPVYSEEARTGFSRFADYFAADSHPDARTWERFFRFHTGELGPVSFGSGWVFLTPDGTAFLITNHHVVSSAAEARVFFEDRNGTTTVYSGIDVVYADQSIDLAVLLLPDGSFDTGLPLFNGATHDGQPVVAVGYPGLGRTPLWQYSEGIVSNCAVRVVADYAFVIQHTAAIDSGSSGGPLLVPASDSAIGYRVVGVNTAFANGQGNRGFAIPVVHIREVIQKAQAAMQREADGRALGAELDDRAARLLDLAVSGRADAKAIAPFVAYGFAGTRGFQSLLERVYLDKNGTDWMHSFFSSPIETMRAAVLARCLAEIRRIDAGTTLRYVGIDPNDRDLLGTGGEVRTVIVVNGFTTPVVWVRERGEWRVKRADLRNLVVAEMPITPGDA